MIKKFFYDLETTGLDSKQHCIHQLSGAIEIDGTTVEVFDIKMRPHDKAKVDPKALEVSGLTEETIRGYKLSYQQGYGAVVEILSRYVDKYNKTDKMWLVGYNNRAFDDQFFRMMFSLAGDEYFGSWFYSDSRDVLVLASEYLEARRHRMPDFKLMTVAKELGISVDDSKLHDGLYDVGLTREIYKIVTGREVEI